MLMGEEAPVAVSPPGEDVTVYEVMGEEPGLAGAVKTTVAVPLDAVAETAVGAPGTIPEKGVTGALGAENGPVPIALVAVTVKVYGVPFVRPVTVMGEDAPDTMMPSGDEVTV